MPPDAYDYVVHPRVDRGSRSLENAKEESGCGVQLERPCQRHTCFRASSGLGISHWTHTRPVLVLLPPSYATLPIYLLPSVHGESI